MPSFLTSYDGYDSFNGRQTDEDELNESRLSISFEGNSLLSDQRKDEVAVDHAIAALKKCLQHYDEKAQSCDYRLEQLGLSFKDFPEDLKSDLMDTFKDDDGVFNFSPARSEMVTINANHVLDSLQEKYQLGQLQTLNNQLATLTEEFSSQHDNLERKLNAEKEESDKLDDKRFDKEANLMIFNDKLKEASWELKKLQQVSQGTQKPKYSLDDLESFRKEISKLETEIAFTNTKLSKYNKLPLSEKYAQKQLEKMREDLIKVDKELKKKINDVNEI